MGNPRTVFSNLCLFIMLGLLIGLVPGCGSSSPEQVVADFWAAIEADDFEKAGSYCTSRMSGNEFSDPSVFSTMSPQDLGDNPFTVENLESELEGEDAGVWHKDADWFVFEMKNEGGQWKIDGMDIDMSWLEDMMEGLEGMPEGMDEMMENMPGMPSKDD